MKLSWILLLAVWLRFAPMCFGNKPRCYPSGNCYTFLITNLTFSNANLSCGQKGSLTTMKSEQEKREVLQFATQLQYRRNVNEFWIGLYQPEKTCFLKDKNLYGFVWISGEEETQVSEWDKIPKKTCIAKKKCVILQSRWNSTNSGFGNLTWFWKNEKCNRTFASICRFSKDFFPTEDLLSTTPTNQPMELTSSPQTTETTPPSINVLCREFRDNETITCEVENVPYSCNITHCFCGQMDDKGGGYGQKSCRENQNESCLGQCVRSSNISCVCGNHQTSCDRAECTIDASITAMTRGPVVQAAATSSPFSDDETLLDKLVIPLILGLVALGILIMLVWGGVQMGVRKKKPKRKKSIIPVVEPEGSDTDSTDNSSDEEEEDSQDMAEMA